MANKTVYPYGTGGSLPSSIGIINDVTTGGADKALSAEQGKVLQEEIEGVSSEYSAVLVNGIFPPPVGYANGLVFYLDGKDFVPGQVWVDKIGNVSFAMTDCTKDGNGVRLNGSSSRGVSTNTLDFPNQLYTIEMVVKAEKSVAATSESQLVFSSAISGGLALGYGYIDSRSRRVFTNQVDTTNVNLAYDAPDIGVHRYSVNKDVSVLNGSTLNHGDANGIVKWNPSVSPVVGSTYTGAFFFKGIIYAIRVYNRLLTESEMITNQAFDIINYEL